MNIFPFANQTCPEGESIADELYESAIHEGILSFYRQYFN